MIECLFEDKVKVSLRHAVITAIGFKDNKILMIERADHLTNGGKFGLPGGFLDRDEFLVEAVRREVLEETGYECIVKTLFRINDNPNRNGEDRQNVDFVFFVDIGEKISNPDHEVKSVQWFGLNDLPNLERIAFDHFENIQLYKKYLHQKFPLPILS